MMTALLGFLLLLCVGYSYQLDTGYLRDASGSIIPFALRGGYTRPVKIDGVIDLRYRNFSNLLFYKYTSIMFREEVTDIHTCDAMCEHTYNCAKFHLVTGVDYPKGCTLFTKCAEAIISPMYTGDTKPCDVTKKGCIEREVSYDGEHRIHILEDKKDKYEVNKRGVAGCQEKCIKYSGQGGNGFDLQDINWKFADNKTIQEAASNGKVHCKYFTYYRASVLTGFCLLFTKGAIRSHVHKIAGPTPRSEKERLKNLQNAIHSPDFNDLGGSFYHKDFLVGFDKNIIFPDKCKDECFNRNDCHSFQSVIGMPYYSGCYMFKKGAPRRAIYITTGTGNCSNPDCRTNDYTYGHSYEIILKKEHDKVKVSNLDECYRYCKNHNGNKNGFPWYQLWWGKTGAALPYRKVWYKCTYFTYTDRDWLGNKQCILFGGEPKPQKIIFRGSTK